MNESSVALPSTTNPKPRGNHPIACTGKLMSTQQTAEPLRCLALRTRDGRLSSFVPWELSLPTLVAHGYDCIQHSPFWACTCHTKVTFYDKPSNWTSWKSPGKTMLPQICVLIKQKQCWFVFLPISWIYSGPFDYKSNNVMKTLSILIWLGWNFSILWDFLDVLDRKIGGDLD